MDHGARPSLRSIIKADFLAGIAAWTPLIGIAVTVALWFNVLPDRRRSLQEGALVLTDTTGTQPAFFVAVAAGFVALGVGLLAWRAWRIGRAFGSGQRVPGSIVGVIPFRGRAYLTYEYRVAGRPIQTTHFVLETPALQRLGEGQRVTVAVAPGSPSAGFVVELFQP